MAESEFCTHKPPAPKNSYPRIHKAQLRSGWRVSLPLPPPAGDSQWPSSGMSPLSVVVKQYSVCDDLQSLPAHVHLWFRELVRVSFFLSGERLRSSTVAFSLPSGSAGADADVPYLCSGIMHTPRCASKTPFRTTSWWRVWSADDFLPFFYSRSIPVPAQGSLQTLVEQVPNHFCPRQVRSHGPAWPWSAPLGCRSCVSPYLGGMTPSAQYCSCSFSFQAVSPPQVFWPPNSASGSTSCVRY